MDCNTKRTAVIYARFSCSKQREASIEDQLRVCHEYAENQGLEIVAEYCDHKISGRTDERPEFQRMMANAGESEIVLVYMMDRFSRGKYDAPIYKKKLEDAGVRVVSATEPIPDCPEAIIIEKVYEGVAAVESIHISQRTKRGMHGNALKCMHNGVPVFGYDFAEDGGYTINEWEAALVREAFERRLSREAIASIASDFARLGVKSYLGNPCSPQMVKNILKSEKYTGVYVFGDVRVEGGMPQIVDRQTWQAVQGIRGRKRANDEWGSFPLTGRAICYECGGTLVGISGRNRKNVKYEYYKCKKCGCKPTRADWLEGEIVGAIRSLLDDRERALDVAEAIMAEVDMRDNSKALREATEARLHEANKRIQNLIDAVSQGLDASLVADKVKELTEQKRTAERELELLGQEEDELSLDDFADFLQKGATLDDDALLDAFVYQVLVGTEEVVVALNYGNKKGEPEGMNFQRVRLNEVWLPVHSAVITRRKELSVVAKRILLRFFKAA